MDRDSPNPDPEPVEEFQVGPFPTKWVLLLGCISIGLSTAAWYFFLTDKSPRLNPGVELSAAALFLGFVVLGLSKGNSLKDRIPAYLGIAFSSIYFLHLLSYFLVALLLILAGDFPAPPSPG
jgi:hypothetical protein